MSLVTRFTLLGFVMTCAVAPAYSEEDSVHTVVRRDSLWKIADEFLLDPLRWPELWKLNPYVIDPDLIYVGDEIRWRIADSLARINSPLASGAQALVGETADPFAESKTTPDKNSDPVPAVVRTPEGRSTQQVVASSTYVDQLIDPNTPEDSYLSYMQSDKQGGAFSEIDQSIELVGLYRNDNASFDSTFDSGLHYIARVNSDNWGQLRLNLVALDERSSSPRNNFDGQQRFRSKSGLARLSIEQFNLPITDRLTMDNVIGTHRQIQYNPFRDRPNLVNYRFSAAEPDVLGFSSQLKFGRSGLGVSLGKLGQTRGTLLPGFEQTEGDIKRLRLTHVLDRHAFSTDVWRTNDQTSIDDRTGFRLSYDHLLSQRTTLSFTGALSGDSPALLAGGSTQTGEVKHDYGAYYFGSDVIWLDSRIGDDNIGSFYRFHTRRGRHTFGSSIELRRDGLSGDAANQIDTSFFSVSMSRRLGRRSTLSGVYNYRRTEISNHSLLIDEESESAQDSSNFYRRRGARNEHTLRSYYTRNHQQNSRSTLGVVLRTRNETKEVQLNYGWNKDLDNDSSVEMAASYRRGFDTPEQSSEANINGSWNKQFASGSFLSMGVGYSQSRAAIEDSRGVTGYVNLEQPLTRRLALSLQLDYNHSQADYEFDEDIAGSLFTENRFEDERLNGLKQFSALASLTYRRGGNSRSDTVRSLNGSGRGTGRVQGYVFVDNNQDGVRQPGEPGLAGVTVFLNSVYPVLTDSQGAYRFPSVGLGEHFVFIDESTLPLPWTLANGEYTSLAVQLRRTTKVNIAVSPINLADSD